MRVTTTIYLDFDVREKARYILKENGMSLSRYIERLLNDLINQSERRLNKDAVI